MEIDLSPQSSPDTPHHTAQFKNLPPPPRPVAYKECMRNHAANIGGHAVDGCGEYMPSPMSLTCAACGCHRNFHRREPEFLSTITPPFLNFRHPNRSSPSPRALLALSTAVEAEERHREPATPRVENNPGGRKRFRTKFSQEQKERMHSFAEKIGWKMHRSYEAAVAEFCREVGVSRGVLKVWMHNNKNTLGKKEIVNGGAISSENDDNEELGKVGNGGRFRQSDSGGGAHFQDSNNGP